jgi:hypothetical protein
MSFRSKTSPSRRGGIALWSVFLLLGACGGQGGWRSLDALDDLKDDFNADAGRYRIVLLLSPT